MASIWNIFAKPDGAVANPANPTPATPAPVGSQPTAIPPAAEGDKSPLANYDKLWETPKIEGTPSPKLGEGFNFDPSKLAEAAKSLDFVKVIPPEVMALASKGDAAALAQVVNLAGQAGFAQSATVAGKLVETAMAKFTDQFNANLPQMIRDRTAQSMSGENPAYKDPAVAPIIEQVRNQLLARHPNATPQDIKEHTDAYLAGLGVLLTGAPGASKNAPASKGTEDWLSYFGQP